MAASFHGAVIPWRRPSMAASFHGGVISWWRHFMAASFHRTDNGTAYKNVVVERKITFTLHNLFCHL